MIFWLGTHEPAWLQLHPAPWFVSHVRLRRRVRLPRAAQPWALDSGAFSELGKHGRFTTSPDQYAAAVSAYQAEVGHLAWAAPQDWMCEPDVLARTGRTVGYHQHATVDNYLHLSGLGAPVVPVLQGWAPDDYVRCADLYAASGVDLAAMRVVGVGSVCRRQAGTAGAAVFVALAPLGLRLHGFGLKLTGLQHSAGLLASADSMAWSYDARRARPLPGHRHKQCQNCPEWALAWRRRVLAAVARAPAEHQLRLAAG